MKEGREGGRGAGREGRKEGEKGGREEKGCTWSEDVSGQGMEEQRLAFGGQWVVETVQAATEDTLARLSIGEIEERRNEGQATNIRDRRTGG